MQLSARLIATRLIKITKTKEPNILSAVQGYREHPDEDDDWNDIICFENAGDMEELNDIIEKELKTQLEDIDAPDYRSPLAIAEMVWKFINYSQGICNAGYIRNLDMPVLNHFKSQYPALFETMLVWAWG